MRSVWGAGGCCAALSVHASQFEDDSFLPKMCGKRDDQEAQCMEETAKALIATGQFR